MMASTAASVAGPAAAASVPQATKHIAEQTARSLPWICNMPTRAIASVLLKQEKEMMDHADLFEEAEKSGLMRSRRHFKHCLRMMKNQKRICIICNGPEKVGSAKLKFSVKLTQRGSSIYTRYSQEPHRELDKRGGRGLQDALV